MKGLFYKDLISLRGTLKIMGIMLLMFCILFIPQGNITAYAMITLMSAMMVITSMGLDDQAKWNEYALTMPVTRKEIVLSKYLVALFLILGGSVISGIVSVIASFFIKTDMGVWETLGSIGIIALIALVFISVILPLIYKFGTEKARLLIIAIALIPSVIFFILVDYFDFGMEIPQMSPLIMGIILLIGIIFFIVVSYFVSLKIYTDKEF